MNKILIIIDPQNDFCSEGGSLANKECIETVPKIVKYLEEHGSEYKDIIYTQDTHTDNYLKTLEGKHLPIKHCIDYTWGHEVNTNIVKALENIHTSKWSFRKRSFGHTAWDYDIYDIIHEDTQIDICGFCTDICVISNALILKADYSNTEINCLSNLCAGTTPENHEAALKVMKSCQINVV